MQFLLAHAKELVSLLGPLITWAINRALRMKAKLVLATPHGFTFLVPEPQVDREGKIIRPSQLVQTSSYFLKNTGNESARKVEVVFNWRPACLNYFPLRHAEEHVEADGRYILIFDSLAPGEDIIFELLAFNGDNPALLTARCEQCSAKIITMRPMQVFKPWFIRLVQALILVGSFASIYLLITLLQLLILKTPIWH